MTEKASNPNSTTAHRDDPKKGAVQPQEKQPEDGKPRVPHGRAEPGGKTVGRDVVDAARRVPTPSRTK